MCSSFEKSLLNIASPVLEGLKPAALIMCKKEELINFQKIAYPHLKKKGIKATVLGKCKFCFRLYIYNEKMLLNLLKGKKEKKVLSFYGYENMNLNQMLFKLKVNFIMKTEGFPHEIGIFLGYPIDDVLGFIKNQGKNYKICGYWKVYNNIQSAKESFQKYELCKNKYRQRVYNNENFIDIIGA